MMWHWTSLAVRGITSGSIRRPLLHLLLVPVLLGHWNPFSMTLPTMSFTELLFQHVLMDVGDVVSQAISVKTAQSLRPTNQFKSRRLSLSLIISSPVKILRPNIPAVVMMMVSQKMIWTFQKTLMLYRKHYEI